MSFDIEPRSARGAVIAALSARGTIHQIFRDGPELVGNLIVCSAGGAAALRALADIMTGALTYAGVKHHITLSMLGADRLSLSGFFLAKLTQENLVRVSGLDYTILRSAPFFETIYGITTDADNGRELRLPPMPMQPVAAGDIAQALADVALSPPVNGILEIAGPQTFRLTDLALEVLTAFEDPRQVTADPRALYFGAEVGAERLVAENPWRVGPTCFDDWLRGCLARE